MIVKKEPTKKSKIERFKISEIFPCSPDVIDDDESKPAHQKAYMARYFPKPKSDPEVFKRKFK